MNDDKPKGEVRFEFWFRDGHRIMRRRVAAGLLEHPEVWNGWRWVRGSPYDLDAITGMGEDPWRRGECAERWDLNQAREYAAAHRIDLFTEDPDPAPKADWEVWYRDTFDRECPPKVDAYGNGLVKGLMELWARHLFEGLNGFSRFDLFWKQEKKWIEICGNGKGAARLRTWMFGAKETADRGYVEEADIELLEKTAIAHAKLILMNKTSDFILGLAATAADRQDFETQVSAPTCA